MIQIGVTFSTLGVPTTGLLPIITIRNTSTGAVVINGVGMTEIGDGCYRYDFSNDISIRYSAVIDGAVDTLDSRYFSAWSERAKAEAEIVDILADTNDLQTNQTNWLTATGFSTHNAADVKTEMEGAGSKLDRILTATEVRQGVVTDAGATSLSFETDLTETDNPFWKRGVILMTSGADTGQIRAILSYIGAPTAKITLKTPLNTAPAQNDTFIILAERKYLTPDIEDIIGATWDELMVDHLVTGSFGANMTYLQKIINNKKSIEKTGALWELIIYDDDNIAVILRKELKDSAGGNITDLEAGVLAQEIKNSV